MKQLNRKLKSKEIFNIILQVIQKIKESCTVENFFLSYSHNTYLPPSQKDRLHNFCQCCGHLRKNRKYQHRNTDRELEKSFSGAQAGIFLQIIFLKDQITLCSRIVCVLCMCAPVYGYMHTCMSEYIRDRNIKGFIGTIKENRPV